MKYEEFLELIRKDLKRTYPAAQIEEIIKSEGGFKREYETALRLSKSGNAKEAYEHVLTGIGACVRMEY